MMLSDIEQKLVNSYQRDFPLVHRPFHIIADELRTDPATVLQLLQRLITSGVISRVGPVFRPNTVGASTLAAMSVAPSELANVAGLISTYPEVNHNYERHHEFNLWFVVNAATAVRRDAVIKEIEQETRLMVMSLPLICDYHIDLGFDLEFDQAERRPTASMLRKNNSGASDVTRQHLALVSVLQRGLKLTANPFADIAARSKLSEARVLELIADMLHSGTMKRFGIVVRHHELGYRANAMCVWDVADNHVDALGEMLAREPYVTLCYRRRRSLPHWPYNLFCMIHGKQRPRVLQQIAELTAQFNLTDVPGAVLFSGRRFKQRGALHSLRRDVAPGDALVAHG